MSMLDNNKKAYKRSIYISKKKKEEKWAKDMGSSKEKTQMALKHEEMLNFTSIRVRQIIKPQRHYYSPVRLGKNF